MDKYFYIAVASEDFEEVKHTYYEAPSTYLRVYNSSRIDELEAELYAIQQQNKQMKEAFEKSVSTLQKIEKREELYASEEDILRDLESCLQSIKGGSDNES